jgi:transposase
MRRSESQFETSSLVLPTRGSGIRRRQFTAEEKLTILRQADACTRPGELSALLRQNELYHSHLAVWRKQRDEGTLAALAPKKRGPRLESKELEVLRKRIDILEREKRQLERRLLEATTNKDTDDEDGIENN